MAEGKRTRRSAEEVKAEKKIKFQQEIEKHREAIKVLEQKLVDLDKPPKKSKKEIKEDLGKKLLKEKSLEEIAAFMGVSLEDLQ